MWLKKISDNPVRLTAIIVGLGVSLTFSAISMTETAGAGYDNAPILPGQPQRYNPLQHKSSSGRTTSSLSSSDREMDNNSLLRSAEQLRNTEMSAEQRALNYQWLQQHQGDDDPQVGGKVLQTLMKMGFKTYWEGTRINLDSNDEALPNSDGNGKVTDDIDYKIRMSGDKIKLSFEYEF